MLYSTCGRLRITGKFRGMRSSGMRSSLARLPFVNAVLTYVPRSFVGNTTTNNEKAPRSKAA